MSTRVSARGAAMRKAPRQARSRATVEAIIIAGARILDARGWPGFTTNEVASVAGVSIGSLYQYFPNKIALIDAIRQQHFDDVLAVLRRAGESSRGPKRRVEDLVTDMIAIHDEHPALHRTLLDLPCSEEAQSSVDAFHDAYLRGYGAVMAAYQGTAGAKVDAVRVQVLSSAVEGVIHNAARRGVLARPKLKRELVGLVCRYLEQAN